MQADAKTTRNVGDSAGFESIDFDVVLDERKRSDDGVDLEAPARAPSPPGSRARQQAADREAHLYIPIGLASQQEALAPHTRSTAESAEAGLKEFPERSEAFGAECAFRERDAFGLRRTYRDSYPRPLFRGWIHGAVTTACLIAVLWGIAAPVPLAFAYMFAAKGVSYGASAVFHLMPWTCARHERWAMTVDVVMVPVGILGGIIPFSAAAGLLDDEAFLWRELLLGVAVVAVVCSLVFIQMPRDFLAPPGNGAPRSLVCVLYYIYCEIVAGLAIGFASPLWLFTPPMYCSAFMCAAGVDWYRDKQKEPVCLPHHRKGVWSLHEDFHFLLLAADLLVVYIAWGLLDVGEA